MKRYEYTIQLKVAVEAPSESDAEELLEDVFGEGGQFGLDVTEFDVIEVEHTV